MKKTCLFLALIVFLGLGALGCSGNRAEELFDTAQLEELQNNPEHALVLYREILEKYPDSQAAARARERLKVLGQ